MPIPLRYCERLTQSGTTFRNIWFGINMAQLPIITFILIFYFFLYIMSILSFPRIKIKLIYQVLGRKRSHKIAISSISWPANERVAWKYIEPSPTLIRSTFQKFSKGEQNKWITSFTCMWVGSTVVNLILNSFPYYINRHIHNFPILLEFHHHDGWDQ